MSRTGKFFSITFSGSKFPKFLFLSYPNAITENSSIFMEKEEAVEMPIVQYRVLVPQGTKHKTKRRNKKSRINHKKINSKEYGIHKVNRKGGISRYRDEVFKEACEYFKNDLMEFDKCPGPKNKIFKKIVNRISVTPGNSASVRAVYTRFYKKQLGTEKYFSKTKQNK